MNTPTQHRALPELADRRVDEIEDALFAEIGRERTARRARRGRVWMGGAAAAAVVVVAAVIAPSVVGSLGSGAGSNESALDAPVIATDSGGAFAEDGRLSDQMASEEMATDLAAPDRDIITTASATVVVDDVTVAARTVGNAAVARGGYVESMNVGTSGDPRGMEGGVVYDTYPYPYPYPNDAAWISVRVPSAELPAMIDELSDLGEVTASSVNRQDVTDQTVDLQARIDATQASVDRLTELMGEASDLSDLIAAEAALSERQAMLESYQQQLESLEGMVELSTLSVTLTPRSEPVTADPAGFGDGLAAGWNGLVATLNGIVVALGFLIPWLAVIGVAALVVWGVVRLVRRRRTRDASPPADPES